MENNSFSCCFTGYRPNKFPYKISRKDPEFLKFENRLYETVSELLDKGCDTFYCGMAMGFDLLAAEAVLFFKQTEKYENVRLIAAIPYKGQDKGFSELWKKKYNRVLAASEKQVLISDSYFAGCFQKRNIFMVDNSDYVLTWFDGERGGTKNTLDYAKKKERYIINLCEL